MKTLSKELQNRVKKEITHTQSLLDKEMKFSEDLRNNKMVNFYNNHLIKLNNML
jgi:two-component sensor histidine kinase